MHVYNFIKNKKILLKKSGKGRFNHCHGKCLVLQFRPFKKENIIKITSLLT